VAKNKKEQRISNLKEYIFNLLARRDYTEEQLKEKLRKKGYPPDLIQEAIGYFKEKGLIDDERLAFRYAQARLSLKPRGPRLLDFELSRKGIDKELRAHVINELFKGKNEIALALNALRKKYGEKINSTVLKNKAYQFLMRLGFSYDTISEVINRTEIPDEE